MGVGAVFGRMFGKAAGATARSADEMAGLVTDMAVPSLGGFAGGVGKTLTFGAGIKYASIGKSALPVLGKLGGASVLDELGQSRYAQENPVFAAAMGLGAAGLRIGAVRSAARGVTGSALYAHGRMTGNPMKHFQETGMGVSDLRRMLHPSLYRTGSGRPNKHYAKARAIHGRTPASGSSLYERAMKPLGGSALGGSGFWGNLGHQSRNALKMGWGKGSIYNKIGGAALGGAAHVGRGMLQVPMGVLPAALAAGRLGVRGAGMAAYGALGAGRLGAGAASMPFKWLGNQALKKAGKATMPYSATVFGGSMGDVFNTKWTKLPGMISNSQTSNVFGKIEGAVFGRSAHEIMTPIWPKSMGRGTLQRMKLLDRSGRAPMMAGSVGLGAAAGVGKTAHDYNVAARGDLVGMNTPGVTSRNWGAGIQMMPRGPARNYGPNLTLSLHRAHSRRVK